MFRLCEKYLLEDIESVRNLQQYRDIPEEVFNKIIRLDPTFNENSNSVGKYGKWLLNLYKKKDNRVVQAAEGSKENNDFNPLTELLVSSIIREYDDLKNDRTKNIEKDIMKFKSINDMEEAVNNVGENELTDRQKSRMAKRSKDYDLVFEGDTYWVFVPKNHAGDMALAQYGGSNKARWCTAADSENGRRNYGIYLEKGGKYYILINKNDYNDKYQFHFESNQFANWLNQQNRKKYLNHVIKKDEKLIDFFAEEGYQRYLPRKLVEIIMPKECIKGATLLSKEEAKNLLTKEERTCKGTEEAINNGLLSRPSREGGYWLRSRGWHDYNVCSVGLAGAVVDCYHVRDAYIGVRPALILNLKSSNPLNGNHFEFGGYGFTIISDMLALCDVIIDACPFNKKNGDGNDYETSYIKTVVDNWFNQTYAEYDDGLNKTESYKKYKEGKNMRRTNNMRNKLEVTGCGSIAHCPGPHKQPRNYSNKEIQKMTGVDTEDSVVLDEADDDMLLEELLNDDWEDDTMERDYDEIKYDDFDDLEQDFNDPNSRWSDEGTEDREILNEYDIDGEIDFDDMSDDEFRNVQNQMKNRLNKYNKEHPNFNDEEDEISADRNSQISTGTATPVVEDDEEDIDTDDLSLVEKRMLRRIIHANGMNKFNLEKKGTDEYWLKKSFNNPKCYNSIWEAYIKDTKDDGLKLAWKDKTNKMIEGKSCCGGNSQKTSTPKKKTLKNKIPKRK